MDYVAEMSPDMSADELYIQAQPVERRQSLYAEANRSLSTLVKQAVSDTGVFMEAYSKGNEANS